MVFIASRVSVAEAATIINAIATFLQVTLSASLVALLVYFMPRTNYALAWSSLSRILHSSIWPIFLRSESSSNRLRAGITVAAISYLSTIGTVLIAVAGIILPLGLHEGHLIPSDRLATPAKYLADKSPLALATTSNRYKFEYGPYCGPLEGVACPGKTDEPNNTTYPLSLVHAFNSTSYGPFSMQYRRFFKAKGDRTVGSDGQMGISQSLIQRNDAFAVEGLVVDMTPTHPGVGFWNHTVPAFAQGGTWSQDILWLEPLTTCVNTNLTIEYSLTRGPQSQPFTCDVTDRGGFFALPRSLPSLVPNGQNVDLTAHAYLGAVLSNGLALKALNGTLDTASEGKTYTSVPIGTLGRNLGKPVPIPLSYFNGSANDLATTVCQGFTRDDNANATNVQMSCGAFLGPAVRSDGGNIQEYEGGSRWEQTLHVCASTTRASIQKTTFSINDTSDLQNLQINRRLNVGPYLWGVQKTNRTIGGVDLLWGRMDDKFEHDSSIWSTRSESFFPPVGSMGQFGAIFYPGIPHAAHTAAWSMVYDPDFILNDFGKLYSGDYDHTTLAKFQSLVKDDAVLGPAQIRNLIWNDFMANNVLGTATASTMEVRRNQASLSYDLRYAIPGFIILAIWAPSVLFSLTLLITRKLHFSYIKEVLNHTSLGRVIIGSSLLRAESNSIEDSHLHDHGKAIPSSSGIGDGDRLVLRLDPKGRYESLPRET
ncbi:hypothetical protein Agabi119p4_8004 [Agaricus bisporus var. burnettii]|uniref:Uncharacterized protein n=1 Tax=Agaricus bisporus var. burnettii TaxID=192524 RepID=A0A8H7EXY1_AGABI|nr:hypothetical protein Agabi119p4_8004 [Agaricus bisporus var. burnettii]